MIKSDKTANRFGYGCVALTMFKDQKEAVRMLDFAFDQGITHFDVARVYGMGHAESILGEFLKHKRNEVTITTKFGLNPLSTPMGSLNLNLLLRLKKAIQKYPAFYKLVRRNITSQKPAALSPYSISEAQKSIYKSLAELKTDHIDCLLLHEATINDANNQELIEFLEKLKKDGIVLNYGIGSDYSKYEDDCSNFPDRFDVFQFEHSICNPNIFSLKNIEHKAIFIHSVFKHLEKIRPAIANNPNIARKVSELINKDISNTQNLCGFVLSMANADMDKLKCQGKIIFSTTRIENLTGNLRACESIPANQQAYNLIKSIL